MVTYTKEYQQVSEILKEWNPIGVPEPALSDEYSGYISQILKRKNNNAKLLEYIEDLLINVIGVEYDPENQKHKKDVLHVIEKIQSV